jgi:hypothetical protein
MGMSNAERQRRCVARLKARTEAPHNPQLILEAVVRVRPIHFQNAAIPGFAKQLIAEAERVSAPVTNRSRDITRSVSNGKRKAIARKPPKQRPVKALLWKAEGIPRCHHPSYEASSGKGCYRIGPVFDFHKKFAGYLVHHQANKSNFKNIRAAGFAQTAEKAKAIAQRDYDQGDAS